MKLRRRGEEEANTSVEKAAAATTYLATCAWAASRPKKNSVPLRPGRSLRWWSLFCLRGTITTIASWCSPLTGWVLPLEWITSCESCVERALRNRRGARRSCPRRTNWPSECSQRADQATGRAGGRGRRVRRRATGRSSTGALLYVELRARRGLLLGGAATGVIAGAQPPQPPTVTPPTRNSGGPPVTPNPPLPLVGPRYAGARFGRQDSPDCPLR